MTPIARALDQFGRPIRSLRLSVTDRCNLRCAYCMPEPSYNWLPRTDILRFGELAELALAFTDLGVNRIRLTGGEPLLRKDLHFLVERLALDSRIEDIALTTNGLLLKDSAETLKAAGLNRVTLSLDTLRQDRYEALTRSKQLHVTLDAVAFAAEIGLRPKINTVVMRGTNDDELIELLEFAEGAGAELRFIEYMDVGGATDWKPSTVVTRREVLERLTQHYGEIKAQSKIDAAPADRFVLPNGQVFGMISSTSEPFCQTCDRSRITADGMWYSCLYTAKGTNLRDVLRAGASQEELRSLVARLWGMRRDRGAEERAQSDDRSRLADARAMRNNPHLEMHTRGG